MFHIRNCFNICTRLYVLPIKSSVIHKLGANRQFRTSATVSKLFLNQENLFAHGILENNVKCHVLREKQIMESNSKCGDIDFNQNWSNCSTTDVLEHLQLISRYCHTNGLNLSDERFDKFVDACTERCFDFTDDELLKSLQILSSYPLTEHAKSRNFVDMWNALDDTCMERLQRWDVDKILYVCDHWYMLHLGGINKFNANFTKKMNRILRKLPPHQLLQAMFYVNVKRSTLLAMFDVETNLMESIDQLSLNEISVICMAFFKTETKIKTPELVNKIFQRLILEVDTLQDIPLTCFLKTLRYSATHSHVDLMNKLLDTMDGQIHRLSTYSCLHLALLGTNLHICQHNIIEQVIRRLAAEIKSIRLKDLERIAHVISFFDFESESKIESELFQSILLELKNRVDEITKHPRCFSLCLNFLTMKGYYDEEMINVALGKQFLLFGYGTNYAQYGKELFSLDAYVKINLKETYKGNQLQEPCRIFMGRTTTQYIPDRNDKYKLSATDEILLEVKEATEKLLKHCTFAHALPHFDRVDVIFAYDKNTKTAIDISHNFPEVYTGKLIDRSMLIEGLTANPSDVEVINIIIGGWNNFVRHTNKVSGPIKLKLEQSKILGLQPILIPWFDWSRLLEFERTHYIQHKINVVLQQK